MFPYKELIVRSFKSRFNVYPSPCIVTGVWVMAETKNKWAMEGLTEWRPPAQRCVQQTVAPLPQKLVPSLTWIIIHTLIVAQLLSVPSFFGTFEGSLPCSQYLATELHLNPAESNPHSYICLPICEYLRRIDVH